ncbi:HEAT repeat domain-containing protein [Patescibacteria group bacterium]|nr:HEAT repeat domain-containing protein [Patescibacteria group bacterium]MBU1673551.1 HEAT repeat domain-containing protein [Patescibacteria group bacterium]MBU1963629.1 HEAT repeat domain-containing protein [Patescibacteria group bacterium]
MDFLNISFNTVLYTNYFFLGLIIAMIAFIFLRRLFIYPIKYLEEERYNIYEKRVNKLLKKTEIIRGDVHRELTTKSHYDRTALEAVLLKKIEELYVGPSLRSSLLALPQKNKLTFLFDESGISDWRIAQLKSPRVWTRRRAADILGKSGTRKTIVPFIISLRDKDEDVRLICAKGLGKLKARRSIPFLISVLKECTTERCAMIADILIDFGRFAITPIIDALQTEHEQTLFWLVRSLAEISFPEGRSLSDDYQLLISRLKDLTHHEDPNIRAYAIVCLSKMELKEVDQQVCPLINDKSAFVREKAAFAMGQLKTTHCEDALIKALGDKSWNVNFAARNALLNYGPKIEPKLKAHLKDRNEMRRKRCAEIIEEFDWILI